MFHAQKISYKQTDSFAQIIIDYVEENEALKPFFSFETNIKGIQNAIQKKQRQPVNRTALVSVLNKQYASIAKASEVQNNIDLLQSSNTFTVCTAHQPNLLTGQLYFIYKILHAIRLAHHLNAQLTAYKFVPLYYMGSEDADLAELNHFTVDGKKYEWNTDQKGAVGRMFVDTKLISLVDELAQQIGVQPFGNELIQIVQQAYTLGETIQSATFDLVHALFGRMGLVVLIADAPELKQQMIHVFEDDLFEETPSKIVETSCNELSKLYKVQAQPRAINLFYLKDNIRERIERSGNNWFVLNTEISFNAEELKSELYEHPERFSPNVILRGLFQETILPNIGFIGGGGELAYWLQLKGLFDYYKINFPVLLLRNSFLIVDEHSQKKWEKLHLSVSDLFSTENELINKIVKQSSSKISLKEEIEKAEHLFTGISKHATDVDTTLSAHVAALKTRWLKNLQALEKKMLRAEKRKYLDQQKQIKSVKQQLFPKAGLQERSENFISYYAKSGKRFIDVLYQHTLAIEQEFTILTCNTRSGMD